MKVPNCVGSYSSDEHHKEVDFLIQFKKCIEKDIEKNVKFFVGLCNSCHYPSSPKKLLTPCSGCLLVRYCSKSCQRNDWDMHQYVCLEFPVVQKKSVLQTPGPWKEKIASLRERAGNVQYAERAAKSIFQNPRVCRTCHEARPELLTDCTCFSVSYCGTLCVLRDRTHKKDCSSLQAVAQICQLKFNHGVISLRNMPPSTKFTPITESDDILPNEYLYYLMKKVYSHYEDNSLAKYYSFKERVSYSTTLLFALTMLPGRLLGKYYGALEDLNHLVVHIVISNPLFDSEPWEEFMHKLPKLKQLHIVFIMQGKAFKESFHNNISLTLHRCSDCQSKNRIIHYSVHQMKYHMFFSSLEYTEPDVVVVYGNTYEMPASVDDDVHSEISYGNITSHSHTVLVLTDSTKHRVVQGVSAVYFASPVETLVQPQINPYDGFSSNRNDIDSDQSISNEKSYVACLRRKDEKRSGGLNMYQFRLFMTSVRDLLNYYWRQFLKQLKLGMCWLLGKMKKYLYKCIKPLVLLVCIYFVLTCNNNMSWLIIGGICIYTFVILYNNSNSATTRSTTIIIRI